MKGTTVNGVFVVPAYSLIQALCKPAITRHAASDRLRYWKGRGLAAKHIYPGVTFDNETRATPGIDYTGALFLAEKLQKSTAQSDVAAIFKPPAPVPAPTPAVAYDFSTLERNEDDGEIMVAAVPFIATVLRDRLKAMFQWSKINKALVASGGRFKQDGHSRTTWMNEVATKWLLTMLPVAHKQNLIDSAELAKLFTNNRKRKAADIAESPSTARMRQVHASMTDAELLQRALQRQLSDAKAKLDDAVLLAKEKKTQFSRGLDIEMARRTATYYSQVDTDTAHIVAEQRLQIKNTEPKLEATHAKLAELANVIAQEKDNLASKTFYAC